MVLNTLHNVPFYQEIASITYKIIFSDEEGTLWWHAHSDWARAIVYGAIVVEPTEGKLYPFDKQPDGRHIIILDKFLYFRKFWF